MTVLHAQQQVYERRELDAAAAAVRDGVAQLAPPSAGVDSRH
jgi:hypothetical protein